MQGFVILSSDLMHRYMGNNVADAEQCGSTISFIKEMSGEIVSSAYCAHCVSKVILYLRSDDDNHISEESRWTD